MELKVGAISDADGDTFIVRDWLMICWDWKAVMGLYVLVWYIITLVSLPVGQPFDEDER